MSGSPHKQVLWSLARWKYARSHPPPRAFLRRCVSRLLDASFTGPGGGLGGGDGSQPLVMSLWALAQLRCVSSPGRQAVAALSSRLRPLLSQISAEVSPRGDGGFYV